jgi:hypothetical protein
LGGAAALALYSGEIERHWIEVTQRDFFLRGLPASFDGMRIAQLSDIHMDDFTEPYFLRHVIDRVNSIKPDAVCLTGDFVTAAMSWKRGVNFAWTKDCSRLGLAMRKHPHMDLNAGALCRARQPRLRRRGKRGLGRA